jgi:hypothetical protein
MSKANEPAFPETKTDVECDEDGYRHDVYSTGGLSKREYFAAKAMQGLAANPYLLETTVDAAMNKVPVSGVEIHILAVKMADLTIAELEKSGKE